MRFRKKLKLFSGMTITCFEYPSCYFVVLVEVLYFYVRKSEHLLNLFSLVESSMWCILYLVFFQNNNFVRTFFRFFNEGMHVCFDVLLMQRYGNPCICASNREQKKRVFIKTDRSLLISFIARK